MDLWHYAKDGRSNGPHSLDELARQLAHASDPRRILVRRGLDGWKPAAEVPELAGRLVDSPLPGSAESLSAPLALPIKPNPTFIAEPTTDLIKIKREPRGIGGWLGLLAYGQITGNARYVMSFAQYGSSLRDGLSERSAIPVWAEVALNVALIAFCIYTTILLFTHSRHFPRMFVAQMICLILLPIILLLLEATAASNTFNQPVADFISIWSRDGRLFIAGTITAAISIPYVMRSRRVANTFIE